MPVLRRGKLTPERCRALCWGSIFFFQADNKVKLVRDIRSYAVGDRETLNGGKCHCQIMEVLDFFILIHFV